MGVCVNSLCFGGALDLLNFHFRRFSREDRQKFVFLRPRAHLKRSRSVLTCVPAATWRLGAELLVAMTTKDAMGLLEKDLWI